MKMALWATTETLCIGFDKCLSSLTLGCVVLKLSGGGPIKHSLVGCQKRRQWHCNCFSQVSTTKKNFKSRLFFAYRDGAKDVSEDEDDMFDDWFKKYGKVVYRSSDQKPPSAELNEDAESLSFAIAMAKVASDVKAADIKVLFVKPLVYWTRFFIIATAFSRPQIDAIGSRIRDAAELKYGKIPSGDTKPNSWTLLDFGDVVIHIFLPQQRDFYNLEEFYGNSTLIDLPFENQPPFRN